MSKNHNQCFYEMLDEEALVQFWVGPKYEMSFCKGILVVVFYVSPDLTYLL